MIHALLLALLGSLIISLIVGLATAFYEESLWDGFTAAWVTFGIVWSLILLWLGVYFCVIGVLNFLYVT